MRRVYGILQRTWLLVFYLYPEFSPVNLPECGMSLLCSGKEAKLPVDLKIRSKHSLFAVPHGRSARATYRKLHCCISLQFRSKKSLVISCVGFKNTDDMFLVKKYTTRHSNSNSKPSPEESTRKKVTEQELDHLNSKIVSRIQFISILFETN